MSTSVQIVTMEVVAKKAGVSRSTVSRALRNHPAIPITTRELIKGIAESLGYRPNPFVAALMSQLKLVRRPDATSTIALISAFPIGVGWTTNPSVSRMVEGACLQANRLGYHLETFSLSEVGMTAQRLSNILDTRRIQGVVILPTPKSNAHLILDWQRFSSVALGYSLAQPNLHRVCNHLAHTMTKTLDTVIRFGYRKIGFAMRSDTDARVDHGWRSGYLLYRDMHPEVEFPPMSLTAEWNQSLFTRWFRAHKPDVVITDDVRAQEWLQGMGLKIPRDVGVAHLDCSKSHFACAGIDQHHEIMGAAAVDLVVEQLYKNETGVPLYPKAVMLEGSWLNGITLSPRKPPHAKRSLRTPREN